MIQSWIYFRRKPKRFGVSFGRPSNWQTSRNSGFRISWHFTPPPTPDIKLDPRFVEDNKLFIRLANIIHENQGVSEELKHVVDDIFTHCTTEQFHNFEQDIMKKFANVLTEPIYAEQITEESLRLSNFKIQSVCLFVARPAYGFTPYPTTDVF